MDKYNMERVTDLNHIINEQSYDLLDIDFAVECKKDLDQRGVLTLPNFLNAKTLIELVAEAEDCASQAYYTDSTHNVYLTKIDTNYASDHVINKQLVSSKGCICTDQIPSGSKLEQLYSSSLFKSLLQK